MLASDDSSKGVKDWKHNGAFCWAEREINDAGGHNQQIFEEGTLNQDYFRKMIRVKFNDREEEIPTERIFQRGSAKQLQTVTEDDMVNLKVLNDAELLSNLDRRYQNDQIHTYVGPTLLVINPFRPLPDLVTEEQMRLYYSEIIENTKNNGSLAMRNLPPSPFAIAAESYRSLFDMDKNQAIVISGESGAGKTENTKLCMKFLTNSVTLSNMKSPEKNFRSRKQTMSAVSSPSMMSPNKSNLYQNQQSIEEKILSCNPVLESFGNAKTVKNDNSSRFGKYVTLIVDMRENKIIGAEIRNYLLEKVRIIQQGKDERNFHIFYHVLSGSSKADLAKIGLENHRAEDFAYLKNVNVHVPSIDDKKLYEEVIRAFEVLGLKEYQDAILRMLSAILHFGNIQFDDSTRDENNPCTLKNIEQLRQIANLLGLEVGELEIQLTRKIKIVGKVAYPSFFTLDLCQNQRDSIAKELYDRLFSWLVFQLNKTIVPMDVSKSQLKNKQSHRTIGLLDIYGFEVFAKNGFEQFFINYTNERLQQLYIQYVFKAEEQTFNDEGLSEYFKKLDFKDNQEVIDIMDSLVEPLGIFKLLEDRCKILGASLDQNLLNDIRKKHGDREKYAKNPNHKFKNPKKISDTTFIIVHTAKDVEYDIKGFIEKNKDEVNSALIQQLCASSNNNISTIIAHTDLVFAQKGENEMMKSRGVGQIADQAQRFRQISQKFTQEMSQLMNELISCNVQFIRCIKPNEEKTPKLLSQRFALNQIRYLGVLESINVRKQSYPIRLTHDAFYKKFGLMMMEVHKTYAAYIESSPDRPYDFAPLVKELFKRFFAHMGDESVLFGKKKIFLKREETLQEVQDKYLRATEKMQKAALQIQKKFRSYMTLKRLRKAFKMMRYLQKFWRRYLAQRNAALVLQKYIQRQVRAAAFSRTYEGILKIQKQWRVAIKRIKQVTAKKIRQNYIIDQVLRIAWIRITTKAALTIQRILKGCIVRGKYPVEVYAIRTVAQRMREYKASCLIQRVYRGHIVRKRLHILNAAAFYIQGWMKMTWLKELFARLKKATRMIQRNVRMFLIKKNERAKRNAEFLGPILSNLNRVRISEDLHLFRGQSQLIEHNAELFKLDRNLESILEKSHEQFFQQRMYLFSYIVDFEIIADTCEIYDPLWSPLYQASFKDNYDRQAYIQHISVGDTHSLSCSLSSRIHTWGWNDCGQLGVPILEEENNQEYNESTNQGTQIYSMNVPSTVGRVVQVSTGSNHNLLLDSKGSIWSWGSNSKGQLGLNHYRNMDTPQRVNPIPHGVSGVGASAMQSHRVEFCKIEARRDENYAITKDGRLFHWPTLGAQGEYVNYPLEVVIPKVSIKDVSCGCNFTIMLAMNGLLFSVGSDNNEGELGTGDTFPRKIPTMLASLKDAGEKIVQIDCGFKHTIAKTSLGKVYTWGWGERGQLGHGGLSNEVYPRILRAARTQIDKPLQVAAGHKCSLILTESRKIFMCGQNSQITHAPEFIEFFIKQKSEKLSQNFYEPVRIQTTWSKSLSIISVTYGNTKKAFEKNAVLKSKTLINLTTKWTENNIDTVDPPFIEKIANFISEKNMKMPIARNPNVQFESKKQFQKLQSDIQEASYHLMIEQQYNTAIETENQLLSPRGQMIFYDQNRVHQQQSQLQYQQVQQPIIPESENWEQFQELGLGESNQVSQIDENDFKDISKHSNQIPLAKKKLPKQQFPKPNYKSKANKEPLSDRSRKTNQRRNSAISSMNVSKNLSHESRSDDIASQTPSNDPISEQEKKIQIVKEKALLLSKIPRNEWSEVDHEFMKGVLQLGLLPQPIVAAAAASSEVSGNDSLSSQNSTRFNQNAQRKQEFSASHYAPTAQVQQQQEAEKQNEEEMLASVRQKWQEIKQQPQSTWTKSDIEFMAIVEANHLEKVFLASEV